MDLKQESLRISGNLQRFRERLISHREQIIDEMSRNLEDLKEASNQGDRSENAAFTSAVEKVSELNGQLANVEKQLAEINSITDEDRYKPIGMVVLYSTVLLRTVIGDIVLKLYPGEVSSIEDGILAQNVPVGKAIWAKEKGDTFSVRHKVTGEQVVYEILDLY